MSWTRHSHCASFVVGVFVLAGSADGAQGRDELRSLVVEQLAADSPAAKAGLVVDDRLLTYDDQSLGSPAALQALQENTIGKNQIVLRLRRGQETRTLTVPPGAWAVEVRPELPSAVLKVYEDGKAALQAQQTEVVIAAWTSAAKAAQGAGDTAAAAWLQWRVGMVHESQRRWKEAQAAHTASWELLSQGGDPAFQSQVLLALGRSGRALSDFPAAAQWFTRASQVDMAAGNEIWAARDLSNLGSVAYARGDLAAAADSETRALAIKERLVPNSPDVAASLNGLGAINYSRGDLAAAHGYFTRALALRERLLPDSLDVAASLNNLGLVAHDRGDPAAANDYHTRALAIRERLAPNSPLVAGSINNLGLVAEIRGDLVGAQSYYSRALEIHERLAPESLDVAGDLNNLGNVAGARGDVAAARVYYQRALGIKERLAPNTVTVASTLKNLGLMASVAGDLAGARDYHNRALVIEERLAPDSLPVATSLNNLGEVAAERGDLLAAQTYYSRALAIRERLAPNSLAVSTCLHNLGAVARRGGNIAEAQDYHRRALAIRDQQAPNSLAVAESLTALGDLAIRAGRVPDARALFSRAVTIVEAQRRAITSTEARALLVAQHAESYSGLLRADLALNDLSTAFVTLERARARSLVELLAERPLDFRAEAPAGLLAEQDALDQQRSAAYTALTKSLTTLTEARTALDRPGADIERSRLEQSIQALEKRADELREDLSKTAVQQRNLDTRIRQVSPRLAALQYPEPLDLAGAQAALDSGTLLLAYFVDEEQTHLFAVTKAAVHVFTVPVGKALLGQQVTRFREIVTRERLGNPAELGRQLYDTLIRPADNWVGRSRRILICPDGPLQVLPFAALVSHNAPALRYLVEDKPLHTISSMTVYAETRRWAMERESRRATTGTKSNRTVLAFGDPIYAKDQVTSGSTATEAAYLRQRGLNLTPLPRTREEVEGIVRLFGKSASARLGRDATETVAKRESKDADILHFASHGWMDAATGLSSGLALSQPEALGLQPTAEDDGLLQAWEIFERVRLNADLVVLSACETGLGQDLQGEGLIGLTRAFLYAGARSVVVSLWDVTDVGASEFMKAFYRELRAGTSKDVALQRAMVIVSRNPAHRHPFYWTPFILVGDWQ